MFPLTSLRRGESCVSRAYGEAYISHSVCVCVCVCVCDHSHVCMGMNKEMLRDISVRSSSSLDTLLIRIRWQTKDLTVKGYLAVYRFSDVGSKFVWSDNRLVNFQYIFYINVQL